MKTLFTSIIFCFCATSVWAQDGRNPRDDYTQQDSPSGSYFLWCMHPTAPGASADFICRIDSTFTAIIGNITKLESVTGFSFVGETETDVVTATLLDDMDTPSDEECLTYEATGGRMEWQTCGGGGTITVSEADGSPSVGGTTTIQFDQADGLTVTDEGGGQVQIDLVNAPASAMAFDPIEETELDTKAELQAQITDVTNFAEADGDTYSGTHNFVSATVQLANDTIGPDELADTDTPADEECYTYEETGDTGEWQACGGGNITVEEGDVSVDASVTNLDFGAGFDVTSSPAGEANIVLDYTEDPVNLASSDVTGNLGSGNLGTDAVGTDELDDDANTPLAGDFVIIESGAASFNYVTPSGGTDISGDLEEEGVTCTDCITPAKLDETVVYTWTDSVVVDNAKPLVLKEADGTGNSAHSIKAASNLTADTDIVLGDDFQNCLAGEVVEVASAGGGVVTLECDTDDTGGAGVWTDADPVLLNTTTRDVVIGTAQVNTSKLTVDGDADQVQLTVQANATQTDSPVIVETSAGTEVATIDPDGTITTAVGLDAIGATTLTIGSADVTAVTITTDDTGDGTDLVLPANSVGDAEVADAITINHTTTGTLTLDQTVGPTTEGVIAWDATNDEIEVGDGSGTHIFKAVQTFTDERLCGAETTGNQIDCDQLKTGNTSNIATTSGTLTDTYALIADANQNVVASTGPPALLNGSTFTGDVSLNSAQFWVEVNTLTASSFSGTFDLSTGNTQWLTLDANETLTNVSNEQGGAWYTFFFVQNVSGDYTVSRGSSTDFPDSIFVDPDANAITKLTCFKDTDAGAFDVCYNDSYQRVSTYIPAGAIAPDGTGCERRRDKQINSGPITQTIVCADAATSLVYTDLALPDGLYDGTLTIEVASLDTVGTPTLLQDIDWSASCRGSGDVVNNTWSAAQNTSIDFNTETTFELLTSTTATITPDGTCQPGDQLFIRGDVDDAGGNTIASAHILGIKVEYGVKGGD